MSEHIYTYKPDAKAFIGRLALLGLLWGFISATLVMLPGYVEHYNKGRYLTEILPYMYKALWVLFFVYFTMSFVPLFSDMYMQKLIVNGNQFVGTNGLFERSQKTLWEWDIISTDVTQSIWQRITNTGTLYIIGGGHAYIVFKGIGNPRAFIHRHLPDFESPEYTGGEE